MTKNYLVTLSNPDDADTVGQSSVEILAQYPSSLLVRCDETQYNTLIAQGLEVTDVSASPVKIRGFSFDMNDAMATEEMSAPVDPMRKNYYIVQLVGPAIGKWLNTLKEQDIEIIGNLPNNSLIVRMMPNNLTALESVNWVEGISSYRVALKVSHKLFNTGQTRGPLTREALAAAAPMAVGEVPRKIEITLFPGEVSETVLKVLNDSNSQVLEVGTQSIKAIASQSVINSLASEVAVESIDPFEYPEFHNNVAREVMAVPTDGLFATGPLQGSEQIVAVADSGLDTGDPATVHADVEGRVNSIVSWGTSFSNDMAIFINGPLNTDNGPADTESGHGTHVVGSVLGDGKAAIDSGATSVPMGVAPKANLFMQAIEQTVNWKPLSQLTNEGIAPPSANWPPRKSSLWGLPSDTNELFDQAYQAGARIHTNSWGAPVDGQYNSRSRDVDDFMWNHRDMLVIFSAGNDGQDDNNDAQIDNDSIGAPGTAKNCLTVGASENQRPSNSIPEPGVNRNWINFQSPRFNQMGSAGHVSDDPQGMACFSSRGPTDDGRIKPDVVAPGTNVLSMRSSQVDPDPLWKDVSPSSDPLHGNYCWSGGTSMSTPLVAGMAAVVREHLVSQREHFEDGVRPSGALIKAFIINGAVKMAGQFLGEIPDGPNNASGFGLVNATQTISPGTLGTMAFDDDPDNAVESGEMRTYTIHAANLNEVFSMTLCWTDSASPGEGGLQNTLYLQVVDPNGNVINGDTTPFPLVTNNVQKIKIDTPVPGDYTIRVRGVSVIAHAPGASAGVNPRQDFAIVMSNGFGLNIPA